MIFLDLTSTAICSLIGIFHPGTIVAFHNRDPDIPKSEIQMTSRNALIGLTFSEVVTRYRTIREEPLPTSLPLEEWIQGTNLDLATYERKYPRSLFNKGVRIENEDSIGHIMRETDDRIYIWKL
jgi:hypothetical protein